MTTASDTLDARERILQAWAQQVATALDVTGIVRNRVDDIPLQTEHWGLALNDGPEQKPTHDPRGYIIHTMMPEWVGVVRTPDDEPGTAINALIAKLRRAALADRTLGGLLCGELVGPFERAHYSGLEEGELDVTIIGDPGAEHGGGFNHQFFLTYATDPDDPDRLITVGEMDGGA